MAGWRLFGWTQSRMRAWRTVRMLRRRPGRLLLWLEDYHRAEGATRHTDRALTTDLQPLGHIAMVGSAGQDAQPGGIIFLNGTSSSGTTSLARELQAALDEPWLHTGIDHLLDRAPRRLLTYWDPVTEEEPRGPAGWVLPFHDGALVDRPRLGPAALRLLAGMYRAFGALAAASVNVIVDDVIYDERVLRSAADALAELSVLFVGVFCPLHVAEERERTRGDRATGGARVFHGLVHPLVHAQGRYDLEVDTSTGDPAECAQRVARAWLEHGPGTAFRALRSSAPPT